MRVRDIGAAYGCAEARPSESKRRRAGGRSAPTVRGYSQEAAVCLDPFDGGLASTLLRAGRATQKRGKLRNEPNGSESKMRVDEIAGLVVRNSWSAFFHWVRPWFAWVRWGVFEGSGAVPVAILSGKEGKIGGSALTERGYSEPYRRERSRRRLSTIWRVAVDLLSV